MKHFNWNNEKNELLKNDRGVSFEEVIYHIKNAGLLAREDHPNREKYKEQKLFIVKIENYVYLVPYVETKKEIFLKTIIPSRKATKEYLKRGEK